MGLLFPLTASAAPPATARALAPLQHFAARAPAHFVEGRQGPKLNSSQAPLGTDSPLVTISYSLLEESDGNRPKSGSEIYLLFGAGGQAYIYASNETEALTDPGTYAYDNGRVSLQVSTSGLKINADFALNLSASEVTMPFQIFSSRPGTSQWQAQPMGLDQGILSIYNAQMNTGATTTNAQAANQAYVYARAWVAESRGGATASRERPAGAPAAFGRPSSSRLPCGNYCITSVASLGDDIQVNYQRAPSVIVSLYNAAPSCSEGGCTALTLSSLASDPRVSLDPKVHPDGQFDPPDRTAVLVAPVPGIEDPAALADMATTLGQRGYKVKELLGSGATILAIATLLKSSPGFVMVSTHGDSAGQLLTGQTVATEGFLTAAKMSGAYAELRTELTSEGLGVLTTYKLGTEPAYYIGEPNCSLKVAFSPSSKNCQWKVVITPAFWNWLVTKDGANFSRSFVFISACETDATANLRDEIKARAYFAFSKDVAANFATAVERYFVEALARPTHSAEETFYNLLRVEKTHQMIYKEDALLQGVMGAPESDASPGILDGWGWDGSTMVEYRGNGWLSGKVDAGQVWWMLFAARWSTKTASGAANLELCYHKYWSHGNPGGLASPYCNGANAGGLAGSAQVKLDVAYAIYLLDGSSPAGFPISRLPPRWTLAD
ncbi:MAG TPA: hypothetical protein VME20_10130 [Acidimicrobiales bacterium]|nr:hypothetical protein [Acidimicrobiales bacterium]